jgi:hypothetical protein
VHLKDVDVGEDDFSGRKLRSFAPAASRFERCRFKRMKIDHACFGAGTAMSSYVECSFDGSRIRAPAPSYARNDFRDMDLRDGRRR